MTTETTTPGGFENPIGNIQIKTYNEKLEKEVSNIIGRNCYKVDGQYLIADISCLTIELMEYIIEKQDVKKNKIG